MMSECTREYLRFRGRSTVLFSSLFLNFIIDYYSSPFFFLGSFETLKTSFLGSFETLSIPKSLFFCS